MVKPIVSLAIPTNGVSEWVFPVLDSIYSQNVSEDLFEVVITDNGDNKEFKEAIITYKKKYRNLVYQETDAVLFMNQIEAFKICSGDFIKFVNHRNKVLPGTIEFLINYAKGNIDKKTITYFLNDACKPVQKEKIYSRFDSFVYELSIFSSWSGGVSCWRSDLDTALNNTIVNDGTLFPHMKFILLNISGRDYHIVYNKLFEEIESKDKKGNYDVFYAFGIEYVDILHRLLENKSIDDDTYNFVVKENEKFVTKIYTNYVLLKRPCSYTLVSAKESLSKYYSYNKICFLAFINIIKKLFDKITI